MTLRQTTTTKRKAICLQVRLQCWKKITKDIIQLQFKMCRMFSLRDPHFYPLALFALSILTHKVTHKHTNTLGIMHGVKHSSTNAKSKCVRVRRSWILPWNIWRYMELVGKIYRWRLKQIYCGLSFPLCSINMETLTKRNRHLERDGTTVHMFPGTCHTSWELYSDTRTWTDMPKKIENY